jgi:hypothetical protein
MPASPRSDATLAAPVPAPAGPTPAERPDEVAIPAAPHDIAPPVQDNLPSARPNHDDAPAQAASTARAEPDAIAPAEVLARKLEARRLAGRARTSPPRVALDEGSTLGLGRFQFGYGNHMADAPAGFNSRNGTALEEPGCLFVKLRIRF